MTVRDGGAQDIHVHVGGGVCVRVGGGERGVTDGRGRLVWGGGRWEGGGTGIGGGSWGGGGLTSSAMRSTKCVLTGDWRGQAGSWQSSIFRAC